MLWTFKKFLIKALLVVAASFLAFNTLNLHKENKTEVINQTEELKSSTYVINEDMVLGKLKTKSQIVSIEQSFSDKDTYVDDGWLGQRETELTIKGKYKLGINTKDIEVKHIDNTNQIIYIKLPEPIIISLELPYNQINFEKTKGWMRLSANEGEQKNFYIQTEKNIRNEIIHNKELMKQAKLFNQDVISDLLKDVGVKRVIFE